MNENSNSNQKAYTVSGTNIEDVKRKNANSGLSYNEVKKLIAKNRGLGTGIYSDTSLDDVTRNNQI
jgi:hypothetical protein